MTHDIHRRNKRLIGKLRAALYDCDAAALRGHPRPGAPRLS